MTFAARSLPPERDDEEDPPSARRVLLLAERESLAKKIRPRVRSQHQERIRRRIAEITTRLIEMETAHG